MASESVDTIVIGAGVVGLAIARELAQSGHEVLVLEANQSFGMETSSRNSGVIHAGIYYPPGSLKARCCINGNHLLYDYCEKKHIAHSRCGKLILATHESQHPKLRALQENARKSGVRSLNWLNRDQVHALEPEVFATAALLSPDTGIIDVHELMLALIADLESAGGALVTQSRVLGGAATGSGIELRVDSGGECLFDATTVINAAGHEVATVAKAIDGFPVTEIPRVYPVRGHYYEHRGKLPFSRLIYPLPEQAGLGVHATIDTAGQGRFGPDSEYGQAGDYQFDESRKPLFIKSIRRWYPGLEEDRLQPGFVGIRPKLQGPEEDFRDFVISGPADHGFKGQFNLFGIDSPGLTSCLALARQIVL